MSEEKSDGRGNNERGGGTAIKGDEQWVDFSVVAAALASSTASEERRVWPSGLVDKHGGMGKV